MTAADRDEHNGSGVSLQDLRWGGGGLCEVCQRKVQLTAVGFPVT